MKSNSSVTVAAKPKGLTLKPLVLCVLIGVGAFLMQSCDLLKKEEDPSKGADEVVSFAGALPEQYKFVPIKRLPELTIVSVVDQKTNTMVSFSKMEEKTGNSTDNILNRYKIEGFPAGEEAPIKFKTIDNFKMLIGGESILFLNGEITEAGKNPLMLGIVRSSPESITNIYFQQVKGKKIDMNTVNDICNRVTGWN